MSTKVYSLTFTAGQTQILPQGRFWFIKSASSAVNIEMVKRNGQPNTVDNVGAGTKFNGLETDRWYELKITSAGVQNIEIVIADDATVDFSNAVSVTGTAVTQEAPFATFAPPVDVAVATATSSDIAANASRRAIVIGSLSTNTPATLNLRVRSTGGTTEAGIELQPGMSVRIPTTAAVRIRNNDANSQTYWYYEEV